jgi:hypothetical protein
MSAKSQEEIQAMNAKMLNLFYGASAKAGKPLVNAPCWNQFASTQTPSNVESFDDHCRTMHKSLAEAVQRTDPADPLANKMKAKLEDWPRPSEPSTTGTGAALQAQMDSRPQQVSDGPTATRHVPLTPT